jgi:hypothetical protein
MKITRPARTATASTAAITPPAITPALSPADAPSELSDLSKDLAGAVALLILLGYATALDSAEAEERSCSHPLVVNR